MLWGVRLHEAGLPETLLSVCDCRLPVLRTGVQRTLLFLVLPETETHLGAVRFLRSHPPVLRVFWWTSLESCIARLKGSLPVGLSEQSREFVV